MRVVVHTTNEAIRLLIMKLTTDIEDEIDAIRDTIYEEIKDMSSEEEPAYFNAIAEEARTKYNLRVVKSALRDTAEAAY
jgi:cell division protein FtsB